MTLSDGQTCRAGNKDFENSYEIPATSKITKIETIGFVNGSYIDSWIAQIILYDKNGILKKLGSDEYALGTKDTFMIADNEQLIGCELDQGES